jgi:chorismate mutase
LGICLQLPASAQDHAPGDAATAALRLVPLRRLMDERLALMPDVARYKWNTHGAIEDVARERNILNAFAREAQAQGLPGPWARDFFRAQIEAAKMVQRERFVQWRQSQTGPFSDTPDLAGTIRPRLDALTPQLLRELAGAWPVLSDTAQLPHIRVMMRVMQSRQLSAAAADRAAKPLVDGSAQRRVDADAGRLSLSR